MAFLTKHVCACAQLKRLSCKTPVHIGAHFIAHDVCEV